jgi:Tol biopolymer transport system component
MSKTSYPGTIFTVVLVACLTCGSAVAQQFTAWSAPVNLGPSINTEFGEFQSAISADGLTLFFASDRPGGFGSKGTNDLWVAQRRNGNADWEPAQNLGPQFNTPYNESGPELSPDGHSLFFASGGLGTGHELDIYVAFRQDVSDNFGLEQPSNLGKGVNSNSSDGDPTIFVDPTTGIVTLYFARSDPRTDFDIYTSTQGADGTFGPAVLVPELSSPYRDTHPTVRRDGLEIYLSSNRPGSLGGIDLWTSTRPTTNDKWSTPVNLGGTINTASQDRAPYLSDDGLTLLFTSDRPGGFGGNDFYMVTRKISH